MGIKEDKEWHRQKSNADHKQAMGRHHNKTMSDIEKHNQKTFQGNSGGGKSGCVVTLLLILLPITYIVFGL